MSARLDSYHARLDPTASDLSARSAFRRHPIAYISILLATAVMAISWTGFDIEPASARNEQCSAALQSTTASIGVDARDLLDDPQREQPWFDRCADLRNVATTVRAASRSRPGD